MNVIIKQERNSNPLSCFSLIQLNLTLESRDSLKREKLTIVHNKIFKSIQKISSHFSCSCNGFKKFSDQETTPFSKAE